MLTSTVCVALSAAGLAIALLTAYRRRFRRATMIAAAALLPVGLYMTGLVSLAGTVVRAVADWAAGLVFKPSVWAGFAVLALAVVLYVLARVAGRRKAVPEAKGRAVAPGAGAPALTQGKKPVPKAAKTDPDLAEFGEIEEILKRRGI
ncbi:hypothetical protein ACH5AL_25730 [Actinacidiphila glaucinigra]|uniref:hypothetical protein n=1 Tax=Actinacidiphila glaucinigra TaxID=235986 RepID=UPI00379DF4D7